MVFVFFWRLPDAPGWNRFRGRFGRLPTRHIVPSGDLATVRVAGFGDEVVTVMAGLTPSSTAASVQGESSVSDGIVGAGVTGGDGRSGSGGRIIRFRGRPGSDGELLGGS